MAIVTGLTATKMLEIAGESITTGFVNIDGRLILKTRNGVQIDAGAVVDPSLPGTVQQFFRGDRTWQMLKIDDILGAPALPKGLVYKNIVTTTTGVITNSIINNIPSFTFKANRNYRIEWDFVYFGTGNSDSLIFCTVNTAPVGATASLMTNLTVLNGRTKSLITPATNGTQHTGPILTVYNPGPIDITTQIKFRGQLVRGDDGMVVVGSAQEKAHYLIYDEGSSI